VNHKSLVERFWSKKVYLFDLDGTLYLGKKALPGALELIKGLQREKKEIFFFTNNSSFSDREYLKKLRGFGFAVEPNQIVISTHSLIFGLKKERVKTLFVLGTPAMKSMLRRYGFRLSASANRSQSIVVGFDKTLTYKKLEAACFAIAKGKPWYAAHPDLFCPTDKGPQPDCGSYSKAIELTTNKPPRAVFGKPNAIMIDEVIRRARCKKSQMILVGDRIMTDIRMADQAKIDSIHVRSGDSTFGELKKIKTSCLGSIKGVDQLLIKKSACLFSDSRC